MYSFCSVQGLFLYPSMRSGAVERCRMKQKRNYQKELDKILSAIDDQNIPKLLLHSCCAPCSSYCLEYLSEYFDITVFYYNPNIEPEDEYRFRVDEQKRLISEMKTKRPVKFMEGEYDPLNFHRAASGLEKEPERGRRCDKCFRLRLERSAETALGTGCDYFTTTLSISPLKSAEKLNSIGEEIAKLYGVKYLNSDFKKRGGYARSLELSKLYGLYRQDYCGCIYSKRDRDL